MKLTFYTEPSVNRTNMYVGRCHQHKDIMYWASTRDAALSGVKRRAKRLKDTRPKRIVNRIAIVIDESGSMYGFRKNVVQELNRTLDELRAKSRETGQENIVSVYSFSDHVRRLPAVGDRHVRDDEYNPAGTTALNDAVDTACRDLATLFDRSATADSKLDQSCLVVVLTDGQENSSGVSRAHVAGQIKKLTATDRWTFAFQVPRGHKKSLAGLYGVPEGNILEWDTATVEGFRATTLATNQSYGTYFTSRKLGATNSKAFYTTDLSKLKTTTLTKALDDIASKVSIWSVDKETELRDFVEKRHRRQFLKGAAFYQLTKTEKKVQDHKRLLIVPKGKSEVYAGEDARNLLGLPAAGTVKVVPGNHAGYDVFVQSTSTNRKLVRGTRVVYWPEVGVPYKEGPSARRRK